MTNCLDKRTTLNVRPRPMRIMIGVAVLLLGGILGQSADSSSWQSAGNRNAIRRALSKARARWISHRPTSYEFVLSIPEGQDFWSRRFASYRVASGSSTTLAPPSGPLAEIFHSRNTIDALFDLIEERLDRTSGSISVTYDNKLGFPTSAFLGNISFSIPTFRTFTILTQIAEPFVLLQHINHCGFGMPDPTDLRQCPDYSIAMWGDGTVVYVGSSGVSTIGRRQHKLGLDEVRNLSRAIEESGFSRFDADYSNKDGAIIDHSAERWLTIRFKGQQKTVHDFYGAPDALRDLESAIDAITDSRRYTGRAPSRR
jgi:Family of unknown function (DUF6174)/Domain of unknown function (DUF6438)